MCPTRLLDAFSRAQEQHPARPAAASCPSSVLSSSPSSSSYSTRGLSDKTGTKQLVTDGKLNLVGFSPKDASPRSAGGEEKEQGRESEKEEGRGDTEDAKEERSKPLISHTENPSMEGPEKDRGGGEKKSVSEKVKDCSEMIAEPALASAEIQGTREKRSSEGTQLSGESQEAPREVPRVPDDTLRLASEKRDTCRKSSSLQTSPGIAPGLSAASSGNIKPQKQTRLPNCFFVSKPASLFTQKPSSSGPDADKVSGDDQKKSTEIKDAQTTCLPGSEEGGKKPRETPSCSFLSSSGCFSASCNTSESGEFGAAARAADEEASADVHAEEELSSQPPEAQKTEKPEVRQAEGAGEKHEVAGGIQEAKMHGDEPIEGAEEAAHTFRGERPVARVSGEVRGDKDPSGDPVEKESLSNCGVDSSCASSSPASSSSSVSSSSPSSSSSGSSASFPTFSAVPSSSSPSSPSASAPERSAAAVEAAPFVEGESKTRESGGEADKAREQKDGRATTQREGGAETITVETDDRGAQGRARAALREAWGAIFKRPSRQGDQKSKPISGVKKEEGEKKDEESASKRKLRHSLKRENEEAASGPSVREREAGRGCRLGGRARPRKSAGDALHSCPEKRGKREVEEMEVEKVEENGKETSECRRRSERVLARQKRIFSDSEQVLSVSDSEEETEERGGDKKRQKVSAPTLLLSRRFPVALAKAERRGQPKRACAASSFQRAREESNFFSGGKRKGRNEETERQLKLASAEEELRQRDEVVLLRRRVVLQAQQRQREREEEHRIRLLVETNAEWIESLRTFEEGGLDGRAPSWLPGASPRCLGPSASIEATATQEENPCRFSQASIQDSLNSSEDSARRPRPLQRERLKRRRASSEEEDIVTSDGARSREEKKQTRPVDVELEEDRNTTLARAAPFEAAETSALSLRSAPPRCEWRDVRARLLDLCGLRGFDTRDIVFFVTSGPFTFYTRKGILKILEKAGLPVTTTPRRATCILTNDMGYWPQAEPPSPECPASSSFHSSSVLLSSSYPSAESENSEERALSASCSLAPGPSSFSAPWRLSPCFFDGPRVATESVLMRAMNISLQDAARRFHPVNTKSGLLVEDLVRASLHFYASHGRAPEAADEKANSGGRGAGTHEADNSVSQIFPVEDGAQEEAGAGLRCIEAVDAENEGRSRKEENTGKKGTAAPANPVPLSSSKEERSTSQPTSTTSREKATAERHADSTGETEKPGDKEGLECGFPGTGVLKTPSILWLTHITEMWDRAFEACSLCELAGNNDAVLELHALLTAALQRGPSLSGKRAEFDSVASDSAGTTEKPDVSLPRPKKTERCSGSGGARTSGRKREAKAQREREERPRVILVSMPPGCGGDRLVDLLCFACSHQAVREQKLREEKRIDGLFLSMAMVSAQARALKETPIQVPTDTVVVSENEIPRKRLSRAPPEPPSCTPFGVKAPGKKAPTLPSHAADLSLEKKAPEGNTSTPSSSPSEGASKMEQDTRQRTMSLPLPRLSVYDWWTLSRADQRRLLQRRPRKLDTENGEEKYNPPVLCIARWREGEDEQTAKDAVNASIDEAICRTGGGRGRRAGASSDEDDDDFKDAKTLRRGIRFVGLRPPPREALVQRVLAIATAAIGAPVDRALVELLFASSGDGHQGPSTGEAVPLSGILHTLHLVTRTHMNSRLLHAAYHYETQRHLDAQHRELDACASLEGAQQSPEEPLPSTNMRGSRPSFTLPAASWYDAEPEYCTNDGLADATGGPSCEETTAGSTQARLSRIIQNFVLPPLERPLPLPFALAEAPLLAFWRLQQAQPMSLLLQLFGSRNALAADSLAAPMHAFDLLHEKFAHTQRAAFARRRAPDKTLAEVADRHGSVETLLDAFSVCARAVKLENECSGCLVVDMQDSVPAGGKASQSGGGKSPSENDFAAGYGSVSSGGSDATKDGLLKENVETALLRGLPLRIGAHLPETTARFVGELILGGVALLQHGPEGAYEPPPLGCSLDAVQKQFVTERMIQQEKLQTRRKLEKVGEGSLKVLDLRRTVEEAGLMVNLEAPKAATSPSVQSDPGEAKAEGKGDVAEPERLPQRSVRSGGPDIREGCDVDAFCQVEGLSDSEESDKWMEDDVNMFEIMSADTMLRCTEQLRQTFIAEGRMLEKMAISNSKGGRRVRGFKKKTTAFPDDAKIAKVASSLGNFRKGIK